MKLATWISIFLLWTLNKHEVAAAQSCIAVKLQTTASKRITFDSLVDDNIGGVEAGTPSIMPGFVNSCLYLDGSSILRLGEQRDECFYDPGLCHNGAMLSFWIKYDRNPSSSDDRAFILSNGGQRSDSYGWGFLVNRRTLTIYVSTKTAYITITHNNWLTNDDDWRHVTLVLDTNADWLCTLYLDGVFVTENNLITRDPSLISSNYNKFLLGGSNTDTNVNDYNGLVYLDDMLFWESAKDSSFISTLYDSYVADLPECQYPATCLNGECTCPDGIIGIDCNATLTFSTDPISTSTIQEFNFVEFTCTANSNPEINVWLHDLTSDSSLVSPPQPGTFTVSRSLTRNDNGRQFGCRATGTDSNYHIESTDIYTFNVEYIPTNVNFSSDTNTADDQAENTRVQFGCVVDANPAPLLSVWTQDKDGTEMKMFEQTSADLTFISTLYLTRIHSGLVFFCKAVGTSYLFISGSTYSYQVLYPAENAELTANILADNPVSENTQMTFTCSADSYRLPTLTIYSRDNRDNSITQHGTGTVLELTTMVTLTKFENTDDFYCMAVGTDPVFSVQSNMIQYDVLYASSTVEISADTPSPVSEGSAVVFTCDFDANPSATLSLMISDGVLEEHVTSQVLTGSSLTLSVVMTRDYHGSDFFCSAVGSDSEYHKQSSRLTYSVTYDAETVTLTGQPIPLDGGLPEDTEVEFTCTADANPSFPLALYSRTSDSSDVLQDSQSVAAPVFTTAITLTSDLDGHDFICKFTATTYTLESNSLTYRVKYAAKDMTITSDGSGSSVGEGTEVTFTCTVNAYPPPSLYLMYSDGESIQQASEQSVTDLTLSVPVVLSRHYNGGDFFCRAQGEDLSYTLDSTNTVSYDVTYAPVVTVISTEPSPDFDQPVNAVVQITCSADANPLPILSLWVPDAQAQPQKIYKHPTVAATFTTSVTLTEDHNGQPFSCRAFSDTVLNYDVHSDSVSFNVQYEAPTVVLTADVSTDTAQDEGTEVIFTCTVDGNPIPQVSLWVVDGNGLETMASSESFKRMSSMFTATLTRDHHGSLFFCKATNEELQYTIHSNSLAYSIIYQATSLDMLTSLLNSDPVEEGSLIQFSCNTDANPKPSVALMAMTPLKNEYIVTNGQVTLELHTTVNVMRTYDENIVFCRATAQDGSYTIDSNVLTLSVYYSAQSIEITSDTNSEEVPEGTEVRFSCTVDANPEPQLYLMFRNSQSTMQISDQSVTGLTFSIPVIITREYHKGEFFCRTIGESPEYILDSVSIITYDVLYNVSDVTIATEPETNIPQPLYGVVEITCFADSYPLSYLSIWLIATTTQFVLIGSSTNRTESYTMSVTLTEYHNERDFFCRALSFNDTYEMDSENVHFQVLYKAPSVTLSANIDANEIQNEDTEVIFTCTVDSNPAPLLSLYMRESNGEEIATGEDSTDTSASFTVILDRNHNDKEFFCKANNEDLQYTIHSNSIAFQVDYDATSVLLTSDTSQEGLIEAETVVHFTCTSDGYPKPILSLWAVDENSAQYLVFTNADPMFAMTVAITLAAKYNKHLFFCRSSREDDSYSIDSNTIRFTIQYEADNLHINTAVDVQTGIVENTEVVITCSVDVYPLPKLSLLKRNANGVQAISEQFQTGLQYVTTVTLTRESNGISYFCRAEGTDPDYVLYSTTLEFNVLYAASDVTLISSHSTQDKLPANTEVTFTCTADSNPSARLSLFLSKDDTQEEISAGDGNTFTTVIAFESRFSGGMFFCKAEGSSPSFSVNSVDTFTYTIDDDDMILPLAIGVPLGALLLLGVGIAAFTLIAKSASTPTTALKPTPQAYNSTGYMNRAYSKPFAYPTTFNPSGY